MVNRSAVVSWSISAALAMAVVMGVSVAADRLVVSASASPGKQWLMKMDTDGDGTVSKDEMMKYMGAEFDKVDTDHDGTLNAKELAQFRANLAAGK